MFIFTRFSFHESTLTIIEEVELKCSLFLETQDNFINRT